MCHYLIALDETAWVRICHYIDLLCYSFITSLVQPLATAPVWVESVLATIFAIFWIVIRVLCDDRRVGSLTISSNILIATCESNSIRDGKRFYSNTRFRTSDPVLRCTVYKGIDDLWKRAERLAATCSPAG
jgi:hypothetical protein